MVEREKPMSISKEQNQGMPPYIVKFPENNKPNLTASNQSERKKKRMAIINYVKTWQEEHPGRRGAQNAAAKTFRISREWARQILSKYTNKSLKPIGVISLRKLAHQIGVKPRNILNSLHHGEISFGNEKIDKFYTQTNQINNSIKDIRMIPPAFIDKDKIKNQLENVEKVMKRLSRSIAVRNKISFPPLSQLSKLANIACPREIDKIYQELSAAGFHLKKLPRDKNKNSPFYYFAHQQEASSIVTYLQERCRAEPKVKLFLGPTESYIPTTGELQKKGRFISPSKTLRESGLKFHPKIIPIILEKILGEKNTIPVYLYRSKKGKNIRIPKDCLGDFRNLVLIKNEEIRAFLNKNG